MATRDWDFCRAHSYPVRGRAFQLCGVADHKEPRMWLFQLPEVACTLLTGGAVSCQRRARDSGCCPPTGCRLGTTLSAAICLAPTAAVLSGRSPRAQLRRRSVRSFGAPHVLHQTSLLSRPAQSASVIIACSLGTQQCYAISGRQPLTKSALTWHL
jgi:hypothetical protein